MSACIAEVAGRIEAHFLRWAQFDKSARLACGSAGGVIELMPVADARSADIDTAGHWRPR